MKKRFVLLDRDGTIIKDKHYLSDPDLVELLPGALQGLKMMQASGFGLAVLTNQSGIGRGYFDESSVLACNERLQDILQAEGVMIQGFFYCPHTPEDGCDCRKPAPGLMRQAAKSLGFDPRDAVMIGDKEADIGVGRHSGAVSILVRTGKGVSHEDRCRGLADYIVNDLVEAGERVQKIAQSERK